jgi:[ribosomal protein S5]-alanine N-acetyltransferase
MTSRLVLRTPRQEDVLKLQKFKEQNKEHLAKWEMTNVSESFEEWKKEYEEGKSVRFFLFLKEEPEAEIIGACNFTQIFRGGFQGCSLGYRIGQRFQGKGLMTEALEKAIQHMFEKENLHRIMSNYMPENKRSEHVLQRLGFSVEGHAKNYLHINGRWEDHVLTALINQQWVSH